MEQPVPEPGLGGAVPHPIPILGRTGYIPRLVAYRLPGCDLRRPALRMTRQWILSAHHLAARRCLGKRAWQQRAHSRLHLSAAATHTRHCIDISWGDLTDDSGMTTATRVTARNALFLLCIPTDTYSGDYVGMLIGRNWA